MIFLNFKMQSYRRMSFCPRTLKHRGMLRWSRRVLIFLQTYSTLAGVLDLFLVLTSRMSGIGSLGLHGTLRCIVRGIGTLESYHIDSPVLHREASLQKICALEKNQAAKKLIISSCTPTTSALLLYHYLPYYCCMACTYCQQCCDTSVHSTVVPPLLYVYVSL